MIYSLAFIIFSLLSIPSFGPSSHHRAFAQQQFPAWPSSMPALNMGSFVIPSVTQIMNSIPQFDTMQMQMPSMQMPSFRSMPSMGAPPSRSAPPSSSFSMPSSPPNNFPSFQQFHPPQSSPPSFSSAAQGNNNNQNNNQPQPPPFNNQNIQQPPSLSSLPTPDPRMMQNALSSIGSSLNTLQQNIRPNTNNNANPSTNPSSTPSTSSLPPYPYSSDSAKIDAALRQMMPGYDSMTPAALQATISSLSDSDMEAFQKQIGIDLAKFSKLSIFEAPFSPSSSCHQMDFGCQSYSSCFSCYQNRAQPKCGACLQLRTCSDSSLSCYLDGICRLCDASSDRAPMCAALQKRCANSGPPHP